MLFSRPFLAIALAVAHTAPSPAFAKKSKSRGTLDDRGLYFIKQSYCGEEFFHSWNWETFDDPTHGRVNYVGKDAAIASNLSYGTNPLANPFQPPFNSLSI